MSDPLIIEVQIDSRPASAGRDAVIRSLADIKAAAEANGRVFGATGKSGADAFQQMRTAAEQQSAAIAGNRREYDLSQQSLRSASKDRLDYIRNIQAETEAHKTAQQAQQQRAMAEKASASTRPTTDYSVLGIPDPAEMQRRGAAITSALAGIKAQYDSGAIGAGMYERATKAATAEMNNLHGIANTIERSTLRRLAAGMASFSYEMLGAATGLSIIGGILGGPAIVGVEFLRNLEDTQVGMAGILGSIGRINGALPDYQQSLSAAQGITAQLATDSIKYGLSLEDLTSAARVALAPGLQAGLEINEIVQIASVATLAVKSFALDSRQVIQETRALLTGSGNAASATLRTALGLTPAAVEEAKASAQGLLGFLTERMQGFNLAAVERQNTLSGSFDILKTKVVRLFGDANLLDGLKAAVKGISEAIGTIDTTTGKFTFTPEALQTAQQYLEVIKFVGNALAATIATVYEFRKVITWAAEAMLVFMATRFVLVRLVAGIVAVTEGAAALAVTVGKLPAVMATFGTTATAAMATATVATESFGAKAIRLAGSARGGIIGMVLFGVWEAVNYFGLIDNIFDHASKKTDDLIAELEALRERKRVEELVKEKGPDALTLEKTENSLNASKKQVEALKEMLRNLPIEDKIPDEFGTSVKSTLTAQLKFELGEMARLQVAYNKEIGDPGGKRQMEIEQLNKLLFKQKEVTAELDKEKAIYEGLKIKYAVPGEVGKDGSPGFRMTNLPPNEAKFVENHIATLNILFEREFEIKKKIEELKTRTQVTGNMLPSNIAALEKGAEDSARGKQAALDAQVEAARKNRDSAIEELDRKIRNPKTTVSEADDLREQKTRVDRLLTDNLEVLLQKQKQLSPIEAARTKILQDQVVAQSELNARVSEFNQGGSGKLNEYEKQLIRVNQAKEALSNGQPLVGTFKDDTAETLAIREAGLRKMIVQEKELTASMEARKTVQDKLEDGKRNAEEGQSEARSIMDGLARTYAEARQKMSALQNGGVEKSEVDKLKMYFGSEEFIAESKDFRDEVNKRKAAMYEEAAAIDAVRASHKKLEDQKHNDKVVKDYNTRANLDIQAMQDELELLGATGKERARIMAEKAIQRRTQEAISQLRPESGEAIGVSDKAVQNAKAFVVSLEAAADVTERLTQTKSILPEGSAEEAKTFAYEVVKAGEELGSSFAYEIVKAGDATEGIIVDFAKMIDEIEKASKAFDVLTQSASAEAFSKMVDEIDKVSEAAANLPEPVAKVPYKASKEESDTIFDSAYETAARNNKGDWGKISDEVRKTYNESSVISPPGMVDSFKDLQVQADAWVKEQEDGNKALKETVRLIEEAAVMGVTLADSAWAKQQEDVNESLQESAKLLEDASLESIKLVDNTQDVNDVLGFLNGTTVDWMKELEKGNTTLEEAGKLIDAASKSSWGQYQAQLAINKAMGAKPKPATYEKPDFGLVPAKKDQSAVAELKRKESEQLAELKRRNDALNTWEAGVRRAAATYIEEMGGASEAVEDITSKGLNSLGDKLNTLFVDGKFEAREFFREIFANITRLVIQQQFIKPIASILGAGAKESSESGGWLSLLMGAGASLAGSAASSGGTTGGGENYFGGIQQRAMGGPVSAGDQYLVGELGPEKFVPQSNGYIVPNSIVEAPQAKATVVNSTPITINNNIDARGADAGVQARIDMAMEKSSAKTFEMVRQSLTRGGAMSKALR